MGDDMEFNLKQMIDEFEEIIKMECVPDKLIIATISERLQWWRQYAEECGHLT